MVSKEDMKTILINSTPISYLANKAINKNKKENFANSTTNGISGVISTIIWLAALYFVFKCNAGREFTNYIGEFIIAFCCSPFYLIYVAVAKKFC
jgi:hypothetical protein